MSLITALNNQQVKQRFRRSRRRKRLIMALDAATTPDKRRVMLEGVGVVGGIAAISGLSIYAVNTLLPAGAIPQLILAAQTNPLAPLAFGAAAVVLPTLFVSQTMVTLSAGFLFGAGVGTAIAITAQTLSSMIAYGIGTQLSRHTRLGEMVTQRIEPYIGRMRHNGFEGILLTRLLYLPHEAVSYASGILGIGWKPLILGTALGSLPSTIFLVQVGSGVASGLFGAATYFNPLLFAVSGGVLLTSIFVARNLKRADTDDIVEGEIIEEQILLTT